MPWIKQGLIFAPSGEGGWMKRRAQLPTVLVARTHLRVYFSALNPDGLGLPAFVDVDRDRPERILRLHATPVLEFGAPGSFDEDGVMPSCVVEAGKRVRLYYIGWSRGIRVPYRLAVGIAESTDGGTSFRKLHRGPAVDRSPVEPYLATSPCVLREKSGWQMWYTSGTGWIEVRGRMEPLYTVKYGKSRDGLAWKRDDVTCLVPHHEQEAIGRPAVIRRGGRYQMWYCFRGSRDYRGGRDSYRIGYATSSDGLQWTRDDAGAGIAPSGSGWDSEMIEYPCVVRVGERVLLFYNGNGFGESGFGYAEWRD